MPLKWHVVALHALTRRRHRQAIAGECLLLKFRLCGKNGGHSAVVDCAFLKLLPIVVARRRCHRLHRARCLLSAAASYKTLNAT